MYYGFSGSWILLLIVTSIIGFASQGYINSTFKKWSMVPLDNGATGAQIAAAVLAGGATEVAIHRGEQAASGLRAVAIQPVGGQLTDNYDPRSKTLNLSQQVYGSSSVAAAGVAAHEAGHAIQDADGYVWNGVRSALVPVAQFGSASAFWFIIIGIFMRALPIGFYMVWIGVVFYAAAVLFQLVTLPVEINASKRAIAALQSGGALPPHQITGAKEVLTAAAFTYVAGALVAVLQLLYFIGLARRN